MRSARSGAVKSPGLLEPAFAEQQDERGADGPSPEDPQEPRTSSAARTSTSSPYGMVGAFVDHLRMIEIEIEIAQRILLAARALFAPAVMAAAEGDAGGCTLGGAMVTGERLEVVAMGVGGICINWHRDPAVQAA